jgi:hypothetical protein
VVGHLTTAIGLGDGDAVGRQPLGAGENLAPAGTAPQGIGMGMLQQDQQLTGATLPQLVACLLLEL